MDTQIAGITNSTEEVRKLAKLSAEEESKDMAEMYEVKGKHLLSRIEKHKVSIKRLQRMVGTCEDRLRQRQAYCLHNSVVQWTATGRVDPNEVDRAIDRTETIEAEENALAEMQTEFTRAADSVSTVASSDAVLEKEHKDRDKEAMEENPEAAAIDAAINEQWMTMKLAHLPVKATPVSPSVISKNSSGTPKRVHQGHAYRQVSAH
jgi:hypothetical protein